MRLLAMRILMTELVDGGPLVADGKFVRARASPLERIAKGKAWLEAELSTLQARLWWWWWWWWWW